MQYFRSFLGIARRSAGLLGLCCLLSCLLTCQPRFSHGPKPDAPAGFPTPVTESRIIGVAVPTGPWKQGSAKALPLRVVFKSPVKQASGTAAILVSFNQPMVRLGRAVSKSDDPSLYPIVIAPPVKAVYRWVAGDTLKVALSRPLQNAQRYRVTVPASARSLAGKELGKPVSWQFETPRPRLLRADLLHHTRVRHDRMHPQDKLVLTFNLRVALAEVHRAVKLEVNGKTSRFTVRPHKKDSHFAQLIPAARPPLGASVQIKVPQGLRSIEGPLPSSEAGKAGFQVFGPLQVKTVACDSQKAKASVKCWPMVTDAHSGLRIFFSEHVTRAAVLKHLRITPRPRKLKARLRLLGPAGVVESKPKVLVSRSWQVTGDLAPNQRYQVRITPGLQDVNGQRLSAVHTSRFSTRDFPPGIFPPDASSGFREPWQPYNFKVMNVTRVDADLVAFRGADLVRFLKCQHTHDSWPKKCLKGQKHLRKSIRFGRRPNKLLTRSVPLPPGLVAIRFGSSQVVSHKGKRVHFHRTIVRTNLGLQAHLTAYGLTVWVTSLRKARPVARVTITIYTLDGKQLWRGQTNARGVVERSLAQLGLKPSSRPPPLHVQASTPKDLAYLELNTKRHCRPGQSDWYDGTRHGYRSSHYDNDSATIAECEELRGDKSTYAGYVSTERGIYRPGHRVHLHGAVRRYVAWRSIPAKGLSVELRLLNSARVQIAKKRVKLQDHGVFLTHIVLPRVSRLGYYRAQLWAGGEKLASHYFRVAEYRAPRFVTRVVAKPDRVLARGSLRLSVTGRYLFGGVMAGAGFKLRVTRSVSQRIVPGKHAYRFGASGSLVGIRQKTWHRSSGRFNAAGQHHRTVSLRDAGDYPLPWAAHHRVEAEVRSAAHRTAAGYDSVSQNPGDVYAAIATRPSKSTAVRRHVLVVTPKGLVRTGHTVTVRIYGTRQGKYRWHSLPDWRRVLWKQKLKVGAGGTLLTIPWPRRYRRGNAVLWLSVVDAKGREARTAELIHKPDHFSKAQERRRALHKARRRELTVKTDRDPAKRKYLPGETAVVTVTRRGIQGEVVLLVERERIFRTVPLTFDARGRAKVRLKVLRKYASAVTLRAVTVRSGKALRGEKGALLVASTSLQVSDKPFRLDVSIKTDKKVYRPGQQVNVQVDVKDRYKRPRRSRVVLMAVDEAVLRLTGYSLPDPYHALAYTPPDDVLADDVRRHLASLDIGIGHRDYAVTSDSEHALGALMGHTVGDSAGVGGLGLIGTGRGGGGRRKKKPRRRFLTTAWHATLVTDNKGHATASFKLPDNLTAYRIMAFALDRDRSAGTGHTRFKVDLPLLSLPALPRLLRTGDKGAAGVVIYNQQGGGTATVTAQASGGFVKLIGPTTKRVKMIKGHATNVRFGLHAVGPGAAKLRFTVRVGTVADTVEQTLRVKQPTLMEASSVSGQTRGAIRHGIEKLSGLRLDRGGLEISLASTALTGVEDGMEQLIGYPYGCLEQKASRLLAMIASTALGDRFNFKLPGSPRGLITDGIAQVLAMQRPDGGFGYWPGSRQSWPWATAYALIVFHRAKLAGGTTGVAAPKDSIAKAVRYLKNYLHWNPHKRFGRIFFSYHAFIAYALRLHGVDVTRLAVSLAAKRVRRPLFARSLLLATLAAGRRTKKVNKLIDALASELGNSLRIDGPIAHAEENLGFGYQVMMHSNDRTTAMVLGALLKAKPKHAMITRLVRWFLQGRKQARFRNTQEAAWAVMALWDYARIREREVPDFEAGVWIGTRRIMTARFKGRSVKPFRRKLKMRQIMRVAGRAAQSLLVAKRGKGTLYYVARLRYARLQLPPKSRDRGFSVRKRIQVLDASGRPLRRQRPPRLGDIVMITLHVKTTEARRYVVVSDPLPAGLEAIDSNLATATRSTGAALWKLRRSWYDHRELRDDRVLFFRDLVQPSTLTYRYLARVTTPGRFVAPPTKAEEMYNPEIFGHNATRRVTYAR
jgi:alpha-2-macroglobulin